MLFKGLAVPQFLSLFCMYLLRLRAVWWRDHAVSVQGWGDPLNWGLRGCCGANSVNYSLMASRGLQCNNSFPQPEATS